MEHGTAINSSVVAIGMLSSLVPKRRRFQFGLSGLFALLTVCALLAHELNWIRQRQATLDKWTPRVEDLFSDEPLPNAPGILWIFGEEGYASLQRITPFDDPLTVADEAEIRRVKQLFPEATLKWSIEGNDWFDRNQKTIMVPANPGRGYDLIR